MCPHILLPWNKIKVSRLAVACLDSIVSHSVTVSIYAHLVLHLAWVLQYISTLSFKEISGTENTELTSSSWLPLHWDSVSSLKDGRLDKLVKLWTSTVALTSYTAMHTFSQHTLIYVMKYHQQQVWVQKDQQFRRDSRNGHCSRKHSCKYDKPKAAWWQILAKTLAYNRHLPRGFILISLQVVGSLI